MRKKETVKVIKEFAYCDICGKKMPKTYNIFNKERIAIISGLFKTSNLDLHQECVNQIIREAFNKYLK